MSGTLLFGIAAVVLLGGALLLVARTGSAHRGAPFFALALFLFAAWASMHTGRLWLSISPTGIIGELGAVVLVAGLAVSLFGIRRMAAGTL